MTASSPANQCRNCELVNFFIAVQLLSMIHLFLVSEGLIVCLVQSRPYFSGVAYVLAIIGKRYASVKPGPEATKMVAKNWFMP